MMRCGMMEIYGGIGGKYNSPSTNNPAAGGYTVTGTAGGTGGSGGRGTNGNATGRQRNSTRH